MSNSLIGPKSIALRAFLILAIAVMCSPASAYHCASLITMSGEIFHDQDVAPHDVIASAEHSEVGHRGRVPDVGVCIKFMKVIEFKGASQQEIERLNNLFRSRLLSETGSADVECIASVSVQRRSGPPYIGSSETKAIIGFGVCTNKRCNAISFFAKEAPPSVEQVARMGELYSKRYRHFGNMCLVHDVNVS